MFKEWTLYPAVVVITAVLAPAQSASVPDVIFRRCIELVALLRHCDMTIRVSSPVGLCTQHATNLSDYSDSHLERVLVHGSAFAFADYGSDPTEIKGLLAYDDTYMYFATGRRELMRVPAVYAGQAIRHSAVLGKSAYLESLGVWHPQRVEDLGKRLSMAISRGASTITKGILEGVAVVKIACQDESGGDVIYTFRETDLTLTGIERRSSGQTTFRSILSYSEGVALLPTTVTVQRYGESASVKQLSLLGVDLHPNADVTSVLVPRRVTVKDYALAGDSMAAEGYVTYTTGVGAEELLKCVAFLKTSGSVTLMWWGGLAFMFGLTWGFLGPRLARGDV